MTRNAQTDMEDFGQHAPRRATHRKVYCNVGYIGSNHGYQSDVNGIDHPDSYDDVFIIQRDFRSTAECR